MAAFTFCCFSALVLIVVAGISEKAVSPSTVDKLMHKAFDEDWADKVIDFIL